MAHIERVNMPEISPEGLNPVAPEPVVPESTSKPVTTFTREQLEARATIAETAGFSPEHPFGQNPPNKKVEIGSEQPTWGGENPLESLKMELATAPEAEPPDRNSLEFDANPERGREIAQVVARLEGRRLAGERLTPGEWTELNQAYRNEVIHIEAYRRVSRDIKIADSVDEDIPDFEPKPLVNVDNLKNADGSEFEEAQELLLKLKTHAIDKATFIEQANGYFEEANRVGLLDDLHEVLKSVWTEEVKVGIDRKMTSPEIMMGIDQRVQAALNSIAGSILDREWSDDEIDRLIGVGELYAELAKNRFAAAILSKDTEGVFQRPYEIAEEFNLSEAEEGEAPEQDFWHLEHGYYVTIDAQTPAEYQRAAESYIERLEAITTSPQKLIQEVENFIQAVERSKGFNKIKSEHPGFINGLVFQIEARTGFFGGDHSNELYHGDDYDAYLNFLNKDGNGPNRWLGAARILDGRVAAAIWELDNNPEWEALFAMYGSRGQLSEYSYAQKSRQEHLGLHFEVMDLLVERMMGVSLKNRANLENVTSFMSDKKFTSMFEGLYRYGKVPEGREYGDANIAAYEKFKDVDDKKLSTEQRRARRLGRIQIELQEIRRKIANGEIGLKRGETAIELVRDKSDREFYEKAWEDAKKAVEIALEIYGVSGEKSKRGGDAFIVDRVDSDGKEFQEFIPRHYAEKVVQFAETWTKIKYADNSKIWRTPGFENKVKMIKNFRARYRAAMVEIARTRVTKGIKTHGYDVMLVDADYSPDYLDLAKEVRGKLNKDSNFDRIRSLQDGDVRQMTIKRPKEYQYPKDAHGKIILDGAPEDELVRTPDGKVVTEEVPVDFYSAIRDWRANWTGHTYWSYQEEDRQLLLAPTTVADAKKILDGELRPEDADSIAIQYLILNPTMDRLRRFTGKHSEDRERKLTMAAVEASYQGHWRIDRELYRAFWAKYGTPAMDMKIYYGLQDFGGWRKLLESSRGQIAEDQQRFARRGMRLGPDLHNPVAPLSEYLGQGTRGALAPLRMMSYEAYRSFGSMALDKFSANTKFGGKTRGATIEDSDQEGNYVEALFLKLNNEGDELQELTELLPMDRNLNWADPKDQHVYMNAVRKTFGRLEKYLKVLVAMETKTRNASGALDLEEVDITTDAGDVSSGFESFLDSLPNISGKDLTKDDLAEFINKFEEWEKGHEEEFNTSFNEGVEDAPGGIDEGSTSSNTGSARHSARIFFDTFIDLMLDLEKRGGGKQYKNERYLYEHIDDELVVYDPTQQKDVPLGIRKTGETIRDWLFGKLVPT